MVNVTFISPQGDARTVDASAGASLMEAAVANNIPGIDADCGGACSCATCHVYIAAEWVDRVGKQGPLERSMLEFAEDVRPNSRLSCQVIVDEALDGITVETPERQG